MKVVEDADPTVAAEMRAFTDKCYLNYCFAAEHYRSLLVAYSALFNLGNGGCAYYKRERSR